MFDPTANGIAALAWIDILAEAAPWKPDAGPIVIVSPHPDDEVFAAGGLLAMQAARQKITIVSVTDGERAYANWPSLATIRRRELEEALGVLTKATIDIVRLGLPDSAVERESCSLRESLMNVTKDTQTLIIPFEDDGHIDHNVVGKIGLEVASERAMSVVRYPIWRWHHGDTVSMARRRWGRFDLTDDARAAKTKALRCFRSQLKPPVGAPIVSASMLAYFERPFEAFLL